MGRFELGVWSLEFGVWRLEFGVWVAYRLNCFAFDFFPYFLRDLLFTVFSSLDLGVVFVLGVFFKRKVRGGRGGSQRICPFEKLCESLRSWRLSS